MKLDLTGIKAAIFDMDGTMIDNTPFHYLAWVEFCKRHGIKLTQEDYHQKISGKRNDAILPMFMGENLSENEYLALGDEKENIYRELYKPHLKEISGLKNFLEKLSGLNIKIGIATTSILKNRTFVLETLNLKNFFSVIVGSEHITRGKPHPEVYLVAAQKLEVDPKNCLAFEDTPLGIKSAKSAGMKVVGVLTAHSRQELKEADFLINNFSEIEFID